MTSSTASASLSIVRTTVAPRAASRGRRAHDSAPSAASGAAFSGERFQARTSKPARARLRAIAKPIVPPAPSTAIVSRLVMVGEYPAPDLHTRRGVREP